MEEAGVELDAVARQRSNQGRPDVGHHAMQTLRDVILAEILVLVVIVLGHFYLTDPPEGTLSVDLCQHPHLETPWY